LKLNTDTLVKGFGIAGSQASGLMAWETDPTQMPKSFQMGLAARNGLLSALLAKSGFSGPPAIFEGKYGVFDAFSDDHHLEELIDELGERFEITLTGFKRHACCKFLHASLDSFISILYEHDVKPENIEEITIKIPSSGAPIIDNNELISHNAQYIMAVAAFDRKVTVDHIYTDKRADPAIASLSKRVRVVGDSNLAKVFPGFFSEPAVVEVVTKDKKRFVKRTDYPKGDPGNPMTDDEVQKKFIDLATTVVNTETAQEIIYNVMNLEEMENVTALCDLLRFQKSFK
jgi:2-methylcitrate dehydratase PrpD